MPPLEVREVCEAHRARIHRAALTLTGNPWDADDLTQETFLALARRPDSFGGRSRVFTWLYGILLNLDRHRRRRSAAGQRVLRVVWDQETVERAEQSASAAVETREWQTSLWARVADLPDGQRHALALRFSAELSYEEIADVLGCPLGTVKSRIFHGLERLREMLADDQREATDQLRRRPR